MHNNLHTNTIDIQTIDRQLNVLSNVFTIKIIHNSTIKLAADTTIHKGTIFIIDLAQDSADKELSYELKHDIYGPQTINYEIIQNWIALDNHETITVGNSHEHGE